MVHELKIHPAYFKDVFLGLKKFEIRFNDRNFQERDTLILKEYDPINNEYTGLMCIKKVACIFKNLPGLIPDYVILQLTKPI